MRSPVLRQALARQRALHAAECDEELSDALAGLVEMDEEVQAFRRDYFGGQYIYDYYRPPSTVPYPAWIKHQWEREQFPAEQNAEPPPVLSYAELRQVTLPMRMKRTVNTNRPLNLTTTAALRRHRAQQLEQRLAAGTAWRDEDLVFTDDTGHALRGNHILQRQFTPLLKQAGLPIIRLHDLRHTAASLLAQQGVHVKAVSRLLGHSSSSMTLDSYSHVFPDAQRDATASLDSLVGAPESQTGLHGQNGTGK